MRAPDGPGCTQASTTEQRPTDLRLETFFQGDTVGHGVIHDRFGRLIGEATAEMTGFWRDDTFVLDEVFRYTDGRVQDRSWVIHVEGQGHYRITAPDMIGDGIGLSEGNALRMDYRLRVPVGGRNLVLRFDDRMYLQEQDMLINTSTARKFGLVLARISFAFQRR